MPSFRPALTLVATATVLAACSSDNNGGLQLSGDNATQVAATALSSMYQSLNGLNSDALDLSGLGGVLAPAVAGFGAPDGCPSFSPDPPPDTDQDGVPDNTLFTFDPQYCTFSDQNGTVIITGSVRISDPASAVIGFDIAYNDVLFGQYPPGATAPDLALGYDGTRSLRGQTSSLTLDEDFQAFVQVQNQQAGFFNQTSLVFTAAGGATIDFDQNLPSGDLDWNGRFVAQSSEGFLALTVTTVETLVFDASCPNPDNDEGSIVDGVLVMTAATEDGGGAVQIAFNACGQAPDVTFAGGTT